MIQMSLRLETALRQKDNEPKENTHCDFILSILKDGRWHNTIDIMEKKGWNCKNLAVAARIHDLRKRFGYDGLHSKGNIESRIGQNGQGEYRLTKEEV